MVLFKKIDRVKYLLRKEGTMEKNVSSEKYIWYKSIYYDM